MRTALLTTGFTEDHECTKFCGKIDIIREHTTAGVVPLKTNDPRLRDFLKNLELSAEKAKDYQSRAYPQIKTRH